MEEVCGVCTCGRKTGQREINTDEASPGRKTKVASTFLLCGCKEAVRILLQKKQRESM